MAVQSATHQRRALELLAVSAKQGCTEAFLLAHGFTLDLLTDMVRAGLATAQIERARAGGQTRLHITDAGRRALAVGSRSTAELEAQRDDILLRQA